MAEDKSKWPIEKNQTLTRLALHGMVNGARQWGITSCLNGKAMMVFTNPSVSKKFGYDRWEGFRPDGSFHYTGQGKVGPQTVDTGPNCRLLRSRDEGIPIHLFTAKSPYVTYLGSFTLASPSHRWEIAPDENGLNRPVVVFHLEPRLDDD